MRGARLALAAGLLGWAAGCAHAPALTPEVASRLAATPSGYLAGEASGLREGPVLERRDFVWSLAFAPDGGRLAYPHMGDKMYLLALWAIPGEVPTKLADVELNAFHAAVTDWERYRGFERL